MCSKLNIKFENAKKMRKYFPFLRYFDLKMLQKVASVKKRILVVGSQWVNKQS